MDAYKRFPQFYLPLIGVGVAALWPLTAYSLNPLLVPGLLMLAAAVLIVLRWPVYGLALAIGLSPLTRVQIHQASTANLSMPSHPFAFLVPALIFGVLAYGVMLYGFETRPLPAVLIGIALMVASALVSTFAALDPVRAVTFLLITGGALFLAVVNTCRSRQDYFVILGGVLAGLLIASLQGIAQHTIGDFAFYSSASSGGTYGRVQAAFGQPDDYGGFLALLIPVAAGVALSRPFPSRLRVLAAAAAAAGVPAIIFSYSRWSIVACVVGSLIWLLIVRPRVAVKVAALLAVAALAFAPGSIRDRFQNTTSGDYALRQDVNKAALDIYSEHPVLGVGVKNFQIAYAEARPSDIATQRRLFHNEQLLVPTAAPNEFLNVLAEQGLVGLASMLTFIVLAVATAWRASKASDGVVSALGLATGMALAAMVVNSLSSISLQDVTVLMLFALLAITAKAERASRAAPASSPRRTSPQPRWPKAAHGAPAP